MLLDPVSRPRRRPGQQNQQKRNDFHLEAAERMSMFKFFLTFYKRTRNTVEWSIYAQSSVIQIFPRLKPGLNSRNKPF